MITDRPCAQLTPVPSLTNASRLLRCTSEWPLAGLALAGGLVALAGLRFALLADAAAPTGSDGGNWLAFARELFGEEVKAADAAYPPVAPFLLRVLMQFFGPLTAVKVLGVVSSTLMGLPLYLILRRELHPLPSVALALAFVTAGYQQETLAWGGYPQLLSTTFLLFSLYWLGLGLREGKSWLLLLSAVAGALVVGTHLLGAIQLMVSAPLFATYFALQQRRVRKVVARFGKWAVTTAVLALALTPFYLRLLPLLDGNPANPQGYGPAALKSTLSYVFLEQPALWAALAAVALLVPFLMMGRRSDSLLAPAAFGLVFGPALVFVGSGEVRSLQLLEAGILLSFGLLVSYVIANLAAANGNQWWPGWPAVATGGACLVVATVIGLSGQTRAQDSRSFYGVLDNEAVEALDWLRLQEVGTVVANDSPRDGIYGWWIEGYAGLPAYNAADPRWFSFEEERDQIRVARRMLSADLRPREISRLASEHGVRYVFLDTRTSMDTSILEAAGFERAHESAHYLILAREPTLAATVEHREASTGGP